MSSRLREFSQIRSQTGSHCVSETSESFSIIDKLNFQSATQKSQACIGCFNKSLAASQKEEIKRIKKLQNKEYVENLKKSSFLRETQHQKRQIMMKQAFEYNKDLAASQRQSLKSLKQAEDLQFKKQITEKQKQLEQAQQALKKSRLQLKQKYHTQLKGQLYSERSKKQQQLSQSRISQISATTNLKLIQESEEYLNKMKKQIKKCQQGNKDLMLKKSYNKEVEKQLNLEKEKDHIEHVEKSFKKFTQFDELSGLKTNKLTQSMTTNSLTQNPEDIFTQLKRIQTEKKSSKIAERKQNHAERMMELKRIEQQNRANLHKKISNMKNYVQQLTHQVRQKKERKAKQLHYQKEYQPKRSKVDYFTEEREKNVLPCGSCDRVVDKKLISHK